MRPPCRSRAGFTLIEMLTVVLIIGVLAAMGITKFGNSKRGAFVSAMKADLRNLALTAESRFATENTYTGLEAPQTSSGVSIIVEVAGATEYSARATHPGVPGVVCTIGTTTAPQAAARPQPDCN